MTNNSLQADFDRLATLDSEGWTSNNHYHDFLLRFVPKPCVNALEIGCGTGAFSRRLAERSKHVTAVDMSSEMIRVARSRSDQFSNIDFQVADAMSLNLPAKHFDCIASIATLHHLDQERLLIRLRDALKPDGVLIVLDLITSNSLPERVLDVLGFAGSVGLRLVHNGRLRAAPEVRAAWEQHGVHDSYMTMDEVRRVADEILPRSVIKRHFLWRYSLVYRKPA